MDITKLPGYTATARANIVNDKDVNPPSSPPKALLSGDTTLIATTNGSTGTYVSRQDQDKALPPDVYQPSTVTPSALNELVKPDIGENK